MSIYDKCPAISALRHGQAHPVPETLRACILELARVIDTRQSKTQVNTLEFQNLAIGNLFRFDGVLYAKIETQHLEKHTSDNTISINSINLDNLRLMHFNNPIIVEFVAFSMKDYLG